MLIKAGVWYEKSSQGKVCSGGEKRVFQVEGKLEV